MFNLVDNFVLLGDINVMQAVEIVWETCRRASAFPRDLTVDQKPIKYHNHFAPRNTIHQSFQFENHPHFYPQRLLTIDP